MRLFHVSEESNIEIFVPRIPYRKDVDQSKGLIWSLTVNLEQERGQLMVEINGKLFDQDSKKNLINIRPLA